MSKYGYVRVSSSDQNEDRQMIAMRDAGVLRRNVFVDKVSGKRHKRSRVTGGIHWVSQLIKDKALSYLTTFYWRRMLML